MARINTLFSNLIPGILADRSGTLPPNPDRRDIPNHSGRVSMYILPEYRAGYHNPEPIGMVERLTIRGDSVRVIPDSVPNPSKRKQTQTEGDWEGDTITIGGETVGIRGTDRNKKTRKTGIDSQDKTGPIDREGYLTIGDKRIRVKVSPDHAEQFDTLCTLFGIPVASVLYATVRKGLYRSRIFPHNPLSCDCLQYVTTLVFLSTRKRPDRDSLPLGLVRVIARKRFADWTKKQVQQTQGLRTFTVERAEVCQSVDDIRRIGKTDQYNRMIGDSPKNKTIPPKGEYHPRTPTTVYNNFRAIDFRADWITEQYDKTDGVDRIVLRMLHDGCTLANIAQAIGDTREGVKAKLIALQRFARKEYNRAG